ncbi:MAG: hypothetical protein KC931_07835 [Candidatus Omnitrophica bacterium]|nr:hypothetical protein [Candidatus Omnitrophota bacterium]
MRLSAALLSLMILGLSAASAEVGSEKPTEEEALILAVPADLALQDSTLISQAGSRRKPLGKAEEKEKDEPKPPQSEEPVVEEQKEVPVVPEAPDRSRRSLLPTPRRDRAPDESQERIDLTTPPEKEKMLQEEGPARTEFLRKRFELPPIDRSEQWEKPVDPNTPDFVAMSDRWHIEPPDYEIIDKPLSPLDPYHQSKLKGDYPFCGDDLFTVLTMQNLSLYEYREIPIPSPPSAVNPNTYDFFGDNDQEFFKNTALLTLDVYKGQTSFRPPDWRFHSTLAFDYTDLRAEENQVVSPDPRKGKDRSRSDFAIQELYLEFLLQDCIPSYDFTSVRVGIQPFNSDFRGFIFNDTNLGYRLFGSKDNNRIQWNLALFDQLEKEINSELNTTTLRDQRVLIANVYRQDFIWLGYTAQLSFHANWDDGDLRFDENGFLARPDPIGSFQPHDVNAYYFGWAGDGHMGDVNVNHAFYQVYGRDSFNPIAGDDVDIDAQLAAFEVSIDRDWIRPKLSFLWASGDNNPRDDKGEGFDAILEKTNFAGAQFSYWGRQALRGSGTAVGLVQRDSLYPDFTSSKFQGQSNFVNPGLLVFNTGIDFEWTPRFKTLLNASWLFFDDTEPIELVLQQPGINREIGWDLSLGMEYRPYFTNNVIMKGGVATLLPGSGFEEFSQDDDLFSAFLEVALTF